MDRLLSRIKPTLCSALIASALLFASEAVNAELASGIWPKFHANTRNTGLSTINGPDGDSLDWMFTTGGEIASSPAIAPNGRIYFTSRDQYLYAVNPDGTMAWRYDINTTLAASSPAIGADGTVYVGSEDLYIYAINADGTLKWRKGLGGQISSSPTIGSDGRIYVGVANGRLYALNPDGVIAWGFQTGAAVVSCAAIGSDGTIYVTSKDYYFYALTPGGSMRWRFATGNRIESSPAISDAGMLVFGSDDGKLYSRTPTNGANWSYTIGSIVRSSPAFGPDGTVYVGADDGYLYAFQANGVFKWRYNTGGVVRSSPAVGSDGVVYVGSQDHGIYAINPDGTLRWRHDTGGQVNSSPAIGAGGKLYAASLDGKLYAFRSDLTPPSQPSVVDDGNYSTSANSLHALWSSSDPQSGIAEYVYAIGTQPQFTDVAGWTSAGTATEITRGGLPLINATVYYISVKARNGAGLWSEIGSSDGVVVDFTAPTIPIVTDDGAFTASPSTLHASWSASDPETGVAAYEYCIGTSPGSTDVSAWTSAGTSAEVTRTDLSLTSGTTCYFAVRARSVAGLWSDPGISDGIVIDLTPPPAPIASDDGDYTSSPDSLRASWTASDPESGITGYEYSIGSTLGGDDIVGWTPIGVATEVTAGGLSLSSDTTYYFSVRALNAAGLWSDPGNSNGITVDLSQPSTPTVTDDGVATSSPGALHAAWSSGDAESGIVEYSYAIGTSPGATDVAGWTSAASATEVTRDNLSLVSGTTYYFAVKARNGAGQWSVVGMSDGILVDLTAPTAPVVTDDGQFTVSGDTLHAAWSASDPETGVSAYEYCIGTGPALTDVIPWTSTGVSTEVTRNGLVLSSGTTYYFGVRAKNGVGLWSIVGASDGILADRTAPGTPIVTDDGQFTSATNRLHASWTATDAESGIIEYQYSVGTSNDGTDIVGWTSAGAATEVTIEGLSLSDGGTYYISVRAKDNVGWWGAPGSSDGITVDLSKPSTPMVTDDGDITYSFGSLHAVWEADDAQSGIAEYSYAIGTSPYATDVAGWTSSGPSAGINRTGLSLTDGISYYFTVKARNGAGLWSDVGVSDGISCMAASAWPKFRANAMNSGVSEFQGSQYGALLWEFSTYGWVESSPAIAGDGTVYIGSSDGALYAIGRDGNMQWHLETGGPVDSSPAIGPHGEIYFGSYDFHLYCVSASGALKWSYRTSDMIWSSPVVSADGTVYVGSQDGCLYAIRPDGTLRWKYQSGGAVWSSPALSEDGVLYFGSGDNYIYAIDAETGDFVWRYRTDTAVDSSPCIGPDGTIYAGSGDNYFYALNPDGTLKWRVYTGWPTDSSAAIGPDGTIYVGAGHNWTYGMLFAFNPDGTQKWVYELAGQVKSSPAVGADGVIYFGAGDGYVYALDSDGTLKWRHYTEAAVLSSPAIHRDGMVCVGSSTGRVYAFKDSGIDDGTPPTRPIVTDEGAATLSTDSLTASWTCSDPESGIAEYRYAIGTWPGTENIIPWTSAGTQTSVTRNDLSLTQGTTYYFSVKARNTARMWSLTGVSDGITAVRAENTRSIGATEHLPDETLVYLESKVTTASFADCFYVQEGDRSAGIKILPNGRPIPPEGTSVTLVGRMTTDNGEAAILLATIHGADIMPMPRPMGMVARATCLGLQADLRTAGPPGVGLEAIGLLVVAHGRITAVMSDCFFVDDGSGATDVSGIPGVKVRTQGLSPGRTIAPPGAVGDWARVTGVLAIERTAAIFKRVLRPRSQDDAAKS